MRRKDNPKVESTEAAARRGARRRLALALARRVAAPLGIEAAGVDALLADAKHPAAPALHALAELLAAAGASAVDATCTPYALVVSAHGEGLALPDEGRAFELVRAAFGVPLELSVGPVLRFAGAGAEGSARAAAARVARCELARVRSLELDVLRDEDPEALHELRVAVRRARCALRLLRHAEPNATHAALEPLERSLQRLAELGGAVRDRDVTAALLRVAPELSKAARRSALRWLAEDREGPRERLARALRAAAHARALAAADAALASLEGAPGGADDAASEPAGPAASEAARGYFVALQRRARRQLRGDLGAAEGLHAVRRALRRVRDLAERFGPALRKRQRAQRRRLQPVQSRLGALNDLHVARALLATAGRAPWARATHALLEARARAVVLELAVPLAVLAAELFAARLR